MEWHKKFWALPHWFRYIQSFFFKRMFPDSIYWVYFWLFHSIFFFLNFKQADQTTGVLMWLFVCRGWIPTQVQKDYKPWNENPVMVHVIVAVANVVLTFFPHGYFFCGGKKINLSETSPRGGVGPVGKGVFHQVLVDPWNGRNIFQNTKFYR